MSQLTAYPSVPPTFFTRWVRGDGNCMFAAFAKALGHLGPQDHLWARKLAVDYMRDNPSKFVPFVPEVDTAGANSFSEYLVRMGTVGEWGDHLSLTALAMATRSYVLVLKKRDTWGHMWTIVGDKGRSHHVFGLYLANGHYENLVVQGQTS